MLGKNIPIVSRPLNRAVLSKKQTSHKIYAYRILQLNFHKSLEML